LVARVHTLGLGDHVQFIDRFVDRPALLEQIAACDLYVTPYPGVAQLTSGALAYSHGQGRAVVSTPYWHAAELLVDGSGILVPFGDPARLGQAVGALLADDNTRLAMGRRAYAASRPSVWAEAAARYLDCFRLACTCAGQRTAAGRNAAIAMQPGLMIG
jgi:glycosyltransferase involved in cell wall biosynthesis